jgi:hypothetical protein
MAITAISIRTVGCTITDVSVRVHAHMCPPEQSLRTQWRIQPSQQLVDSLESFRHFFVLTVQAE